MVRQEIDLRNKELLELMLSAAKPEIWQKNAAMVSESLSDPAYANGKMAKVRKALVIGQGTSYATAWNAASYLSHLAGLEAQAITAFECTNYMDDYIKPSETTMVVGISCGGNTVSVANALKAARERGAVTVCVSNDKDISCAKAAEYRVITDANIERRDTYSHPYSISHLFLLQGVFELALAIGSMNGFLNDRQRKEWEERLLQALDSLKMLPALFNQVTALNVEIRSKGGKGHIVLGSGPNRGTMIEGALKISEFSWQIGAAEELEDFAHGRFRELDTTTPLFIISPNGPCISKTLDLLAGCEQSGTTSIVLTDHPTAAIQKLASYIIEMPMVHEYLTPFVYVFVFWFYGYSTKAAANELVGEARYGLYAVDINFDAHFDVNGNKR